MKRLFLTVRAKRCAFGCTYCFSDFSQYRTPPSLDEVEAGEISLEGIDVIYPACDVDLFAMKHRWGEILQRAANLNRSISVSTKAALTSGQIDTLGRYANEMRSRGLVLKISISASTMYSCDVLEPRAAIWEKRVATLESLGEVGITTCLVLKPVLADISLDEYRQMLEEASPFTSAVVLGDEYVDDNRLRRRESQADLDGSLSARTVRWLEQEPHWLVREGGQRLVTLADYARKYNMRPYLSDLDFMEEAIFTSEMRATDHLRITEAK